MRAAVLYKPLDLRIVDLPKPSPRPGEALVRVVVCGICRSDYHYWKHGRIGEFVVRKPLIHGHEASGVVEEVGEDVKELKRGDRVVIEPGVPCGECPYCRSGRYNLCPNVKFMATPPIDGAFAEYVAWDHRFIYKMPPGMSFEEGAMVDTTAIALHGLKRAGVPPGGTVVIIGPGPVGLCALQCAQALGAGRIIMLGRGHGGKSSRMKVAKELGAELVDVQVEDPIKRVLEMTNGKGADLVVECSGADIACSWTVDLVRKGGSIVLIGNYKKPISLPMFKVVFNEISIYGSRGNPNASDEAIGLIASGKVDVKKLITHVFSLDEFDKALETFVKRLDGAIKVIVKP